MDIKKEKEEIIKELEKINQNITKDDIENASTEELLKYAELNLEIKRKLEIIAALENN